MLPDHHHAEAKRKAVLQGVSLSEYIGRLVAHDLGEDMPGGGRSVIFGLFDSGGSRVSDGQQAIIIEAIHHQFEARGI